MKTPYQIQRCIKEYSEDSDFKKWFDDFVDREEAKKVNQYPADPLLMEE